MCLQIFNANFTQAGKFKRSTTTDEADIRQIILEDIAMQSKIHQTIMDKATQAAEMMDTITKKPTPIHIKPAKKLNKNPIINILVKTLKTGMILQKNQLAKQAK
jgi:hypothetical protein